MYGEIKAYKKDFEFTLNYSQIPKAKANALQLIMSDAIEQGLLEIVSIGLALNGTTTSETFKKI